MISIGAVVILIALTILILWLIGGIGKNLRGQEEW